MENSSNNSVESIADATLLENQQSGFNVQFASLTGPKDEDEEEDESEDESEEEGEEEGNPPLDPSIVHSPLPTQTGGKPKNS